MTVTIDPSSPQYVGPMTWRITWTSTETNPLCYVYVDGVLVATTKGAEYLLTVAPGDTPTVEIFDSADDSPGESFPSRIMLAWYGPGSGNAVDYYRIDEYVASVWTERARLVEDGRGYYKWRSRALEDVTTHQFRVVAVGTNGNEATAATFSVLMVRRPDPPEVDYAYDKGTSKITVTAA